MMASDSNTKESDPMPPGPAGAYACVHTSQKHIHILQDKNLSGKKGTGLGVVAWLVIPALGDRSKEIPGTQWSSITEGSD